jgi:hypothetical protein
LQRKIKLVCDAERNALAPQRLEAVGGHFDVVNIRIEVGNAVAPFRCGPQSLVSFVSTLTALTIASVTACPF